MVIAAKSTWYMVSVDIHLSHKSTKEDRLVECLAKLAKRLIVTFTQSDPRNYVIVCSMQRRQLISTFVETRERNINCSFKSDDRPTLRVKQAKM